MQRHSWEKHFDASASLTRLEISSGSNEKICPGGLHKTGAKSVRGVQKEVAIHRVPGEEQAGAALLLGHVGESCAQAREWTEDELEIPYHCVRKVLNKDINKDIKNIKLNS